MDTAIIVGLCLSIAVVWRLVVLSKKLAAMVAVLIALSLAFFLGFRFGGSWADFRNYDQYVWRFSQYSTHLRELVEGEQIRELTNCVVAFDLKFNKNQDPHDLEDAIFQMLNLGAYYQETNGNGTGARINAGGGCEKK